MGSISDNLFQAIDILTSQKLGELKYDKTVLCEIIDDSKRNNGEYLVSNTSSKFTAYSDNTSYKNGMSVYVTIPEGDYYNRKIITGRCVEDGGEHYTYVAPFDSYLDVTNNYIDSKNNQATLLANGDRNEVEMWTWKRNPDSLNIIPKEYTRMGFGAAFQARLAYLEPVIGSYGVRIDITSREETESNSSKTTNKYYSYYLDSSDFYGNIYNFETYYTQELVFDISMITEIEAIRVVFYQSNNFYDISKNKIANMEDGQRLADNLFIKDLYLSFGFDAQDFVKDTIYLYTLDGETYDPSTQHVKESIKMEDGSTQTVEVNKNRKTINLRWVHFLDKKQTLLVDNENELNNIGATVHWYHYVQQEGICDPLAGHFWQEILTEDEKPWNSISLVVEPDIALQYERYKVIIQNPSDEKMNEQIASSVIEFGDPDYYGTYNRLTDEFTLPSIENQEGITYVINGYQQKIDLLKSQNLDSNQASIEFTQNLLDTEKALLNSYQAAVRQVWADAEANKVFYISDVLTLTNETLVPDSATVNLIQGLTIEVDRSGLKGNYCIYGMTNELLNGNEASKKRLLEAKYSSLVTGEPDLDKASTICWKIPAKSTMIADPVLGTDYITREYVETLSEEQQAK